MKCNDNFVLRTVYNTYLLVPVSANNISNNIISFNEVGACIFKMAENFDNKQDLNNRLNSIYNQESSDEIRNHISRFIDQLLEMGLLQEEIVKDE